jgi:hypothetical protein
MNAETYPLSRDERFPIYKFLSTGSNGTVKKGVMFQVVDPGQNLVNLAFGDWDGDEMELDDMVITNNSDTQIVLNTVAIAVIDFMQRNPGCRLIASGSTASRSRLYQMNISRHWDEVSARFDVKGFVAGGWEPFVKGQNYAGFLLSLK